MVNAPQEFIKMIEERVTPLERQLCESHWEHAITGKEECAKKVSAAEKALRLALSNPEELKQLKSWKAAGIPDVQIKRQTDLLIHDYIPNQLDEATISDLVERQTELETIYHNFRANLDGKKISDNDLKEILKTEKDNRRRQEAWEATKQIGSVVAEKIKELVKRKNRAAQQLGFANHFEMSFQLQELESQEIFPLFAGLKRAMDPAFEREIGKLHTKLARRYGVSVAEVRPWHYEDPFAQQVPSIVTTPLDVHFQDRDLVQMSKDFYASMDLDIQDVLDRSDLFEREGKSQHAFCITMGRNHTDVRVLANIRPNTYWASTMLHELGHAAYSKNIDAKLPYFLRDECHIMTTEAIAMMMERMIHNAHWFQDFFGVPMEENLDEALALDKMIIARWIMVVTHFERELYQNPDQDLNGLWWNRVKQFQLLDKPEKHNTPDWAAKIHIATAPVYYQNYLLGELTAAQIVTMLEQEALGKPLAQTSFYAHKKVGALLKERLFARGSALDWKELIPQATGKVLGYESFASQFCG